MFLTENIISRFGIPDFIVFDNAKYFSPIKLTGFALEYGIKLKHSANYYPQRIHKEFPIFLGILSRSHPTHAYFPTILATISICADG